jgi:beta-ribofuranosylaminobenzene 5'-phosphate synthase
MRDCVTVSAAARLHLGFLDLHGGLGRRFGSLGMAIEEPETAIDLSRSLKNFIEGPQADRAGAYLDLLVAHLAVPTGHRLVVRHAIPTHTGLGSGTQLALAVGAALRKLHRLPPDLRADAALLERCTRSGLGLGYFIEGGIALDGGRAEGDAPAPIIARLPIPQDWRVLLILDPTRHGLHGAEELAAFKALPPFSAELAAHLCRVALMQALPAAAESDLANFGRAVTQIQAHVGDYFSSAQGGRYASPRVAAVLDLLARHGADGYGQSSWGPTGFALAASPAEARRWQLLASPLASASGLALMIVKGRNHGAAVAQRARVGEQGMRHG